MKKVLLLITLIMGMSQTAFASFPDVPSDHENAEAIAWLQLEGVVQGYSDGSFKPDKLVNRAEFLKMLYETIGMEGHEPVLSFPDVPANAWYTKYVKEAFYTKVAVGYDDGYFRPDNNINFVEAVKVVMNGFFDVDDLYGDGSDYTPCDDTSHDYNGDLTKFGGIDTSAWYWKYLYVADGMCILNFDHAANASVAYYASYDPGVYITRADMAELLYRAHNQQKEAEMAAEDSGDEEADAGAEDVAADESADGGDSGTGGGGGGDGGGNEDVAAEDADSGEVKNMSLTVQTINDNELIDKKYTCDSGDSQFPNGQSPGYSFFDVPQSAESLAIIASDPDAPGGTFYHGVLWNIPAVAESLPEGQMLPPDVQVGINDSGSSAPFGPCPPEGDGIHHYIFTLYALDLVFKADDVKPGLTTASELLSAMEGHILETATVTGLYER